MVHLTKHNRLFLWQDYNEDGKLSLSEFSDLMKAFGNGLAVDKVGFFFFSFAWRLCSL
jgi:hypothetical protein